MATVQIGEFQDQFVIHFGGDFRRINAYTLASALVGIADAAKAANAVLNPGYDIEIVVEALGEGSFRTKVRALYRGAGNLFSEQALKTIVLAVIANFVYEHTLAPDRDIAVIVSDHEVVIEQGETRVVVPREVYEAKEDVADIPEFRNGVCRAVKAAEEDDAIRSLGFAPTDNGSEPPVEIPRASFPLISEPTPLSPAEYREVEEVTHVRIVRAILERSRRRWEFVWHGVRIAAPVLHAEFYDDFFAHRITIAPGDALEVRLRMKQRLSRDIGVYITDSYEIIEVIRHIPRSAQDDLDI